MPTAHQDLGIRPETSAHARPQRPLWRAWAPSSPRYSRKGSQIWKNLKDLSLSQKLIASRGRNSIMLRVQCEIVGTESEIYCKRIHLLALNSNTLSSFIEGGLRFRAARCTPRIQEIGSRASFLLKIISISLHTLIQKPLIRGHSKIQWKYEPSIILHLLQYFENRGLNLLRFTGVIWSLCITLNCNSLALLVNRQPAEVDQTPSHSSSEITWFPKEP